MDRDEFRGRLAEPHGCNSRCGYNRVDQHPNSEEGRPEAGVQNWHRDQLQDRIDRGAEGAAARVATTRRTQDADEAVRGRKSHGNRIDTAEEAVLRNSLRRARGVANGFPKSQSKKPLSNCDNNSPRESGWTCKRGWEKGSFLVEMTADLREKEKQEIDWWLRAREPGGETDASNVDTTLSKFASALLLRDQIRRYGTEFGSAKTILELGGGEGWASCLVKRLYPEARVILTDISPYAVETHDRWAPVFGAAPDEAFAAKSYEIPVPDGSVDLIFVHAAAHHFVAHQETFAEMQRVLSAGGTALYLVENTVSKLGYSVFLWSQQRQRSDCPEDLLVPSELRQLAQAAGLSYRRDFVLDAIMPQLAFHKAFKWTNYIAALRWVPGLRFLPLAICNFVFTKPGG